jgi:hypothetical protein
MGYRLVRPYATVGRPTHWRVGRRQPKQAGYTTTDRAQPGTVAGMAPPADIDKVFAIGAMTAPEKQQNN